MKPYDKTDRKLLQALREHSGKYLFEYSARTGIPKSTIHERLKKLSQQGLRFVPLMHWQKIGYPIEVIFLVPFDARLLDESCINNAQRVSPNLLLLHCLFPTLGAVEEFKNRLHLARFFLVIDTLKHEGFLPAHESTHPIPEKHL